MKCIAMGLLTKNILISLSVLWIIIFTTGTDEPFSKPILISFIGVAIFTSSVFTYFNFRYTNLKDKIDTIRTLLNGNDVLFEEYLKNNNDLDLEEIQETSKYVHETLDSIAEVLEGFNNQYYTPSKISIFIQDIFILLATYIFVTEGNLLPVFVYSVYFLIITQSIAAHHILTLNLPYLREVTHRCNNILDAMYRVHSLFVTKTIQQPKK